MILAASLSSPGLFSIYLLAQAVSVPIFAKFTDLIGRKPIMLVGIGLFRSRTRSCAGSPGACRRSSRSAQSRVSARGAIQPTGMTIIGDIYSVAERARVQGYVASVWAISAVVGPALGGIFVDFLNWRWIFFVNIPLGALAAWWLIRRFNEKVVRRQHRIDVAGCGLARRWLLADHPRTPRGRHLCGSGLRCPASPFSRVGVLLMIVFTLVERRATEPILPGWVFRSRLLNSTNLAALGVGVLLIGLTSFIPLYAQGVLHTSALVAGFRARGSDARLAAWQRRWPAASI